MKTIRLFLTALLSIPLVSFAQEREFDEIIYLLQTETVTFSFESFEGCAVAAQFLPTEVIFTALYDLYSQPTDSESGQALAGGKKVGQMGVCLGAGQQVEEQVGSLPEYPVVFSVDIDDLDFDIGGSGVVRGRWAGLPQPGLGPLAYGATLFRTVDDLPMEPVGSMTANWLLNNTSVEGYNDGLVVTLRLYTPRDLEKEAFIDALEGLFGGRSSP